MFKSLMTWYRRWRRYERLQSLRRTNATIRELAKDMEDLRQRERHSWGMQLVIGDVHWHNLEPLLRKKDKLRARLGLTEQPA